MPGQEAMVPAVCFMVAPPCCEAVDFAKELAVKLEHLRKLCRLRELHLKQQLLYSTMHVSQEEIYSRFTSCKDQVEISFRNMIVCTRVFL